MKQIFLYFFVLVSLTLSAQRQLPSYNTAAGTLTQMGAGSGYVDVRVNYTDQTGMTTGSTIDNTCVLLYFNTDESLGYELPILSVTTPSATNPVVRVNITGFPALNGAINGQGVIYKKSSSKHFAPFVSNASNSLQQVIQEAMARDIETALNSATDVTKYVGSGVPAFTPTTDEPKLAQGLASPYPLYKWNGAAWVLDGSGGGSVADTTRTAYKYATMKWTDSTALHAEGKVFKDTLIGGRNILLNNYPTMDASGTITDGDLISKYDAETGVYQKVRADSLKGYIGGGLTANSVDSTHIKPASIAANDLSQHAIDSLKSLNTANNGISKINDTIRLGGTLTTPTLLITDNLNTLSIQGLPNATITDNIVTINNSGQLTIRSSTQSTTSSFINHADAANNSINIGQQFEASQNNTMGLPQGTVIVRRY